MSWYERILLGSLWVAAVTLCWAITGTIVALVFTLSKEALS